MSNLRDHARTELQAAGLFDEDSDYGGMLGDAVLELISVFADQGHSGMSAALCISLFSRLAGFEPLTPLTGEDAEWECLDDLSDDLVYQNKRCSRVFKHSDGRAYDIGGKIFRDPDGNTFTSKESKVPTEFPYTPKVEYVDVPTPKE